MSETKSAKKTKRLKELQNMLMVLRSARLELADLDRRLCAAMSRKEKT